MTVDDYANYRVDAVPQASTIYVQQQKTPSSFDNRLGLVQDIQLIGLADRKATTSVDSQPQVGNFVNHATVMDDGVVVVPIALRQTPQAITSLQSTEVLSPLQVDIHVGQNVQA